MPTGSWISLVLFTLIAYGIYRRITQNVRSCLPPGPKGLPLLGNIRDFPPKGTPEFQHWLKHKDLYGGISSVTVMGTTLVLIHNEAIVSDLLERVSIKTSGRPTMTMANKLCGYEAIALCQSYTPMFRRYRKLLHQELGTKVSAAQFRDKQDIEVKRQLVRTLDAPEDWLQHIKTTASATVLKMAYGYQIKPNKPDVLVDSIDKTIAAFSEAAVPMAWSVDIIPALQYLPEGFPGAAFKKTARSWRSHLQMTTHVPYNFVKRQIASGQERSSYVSRLVHQLKQNASARLSKEDEEAVMWTAASLYGAAADTTVLTLKAFTAAMIMFPQTQRKAQEEIDRVIGNERLPTHDDREKLPYINALIKETTRWWPITPMGFPHMATEDIVYNGYHIPKNAVLLPAVWWFTHDPKVHSDPDIFDPDRFLSPRNEPNSGQHAFGYGRRICPGRFFADASLYLSIVQSLASFNFGNALDKNGNGVEIVIRPQPGILTYPTEFDYHITPRSAKHIELIRTFEQQDELVKGDAELLDIVESSAVSI